MAANNVSDDIIVHCDDLDADRFQIAWACRDEWRPTRPIQACCTLSDDRIRLLVTLNGNIYYNEDLPGEAVSVDHKLDSSKEADKVYVIVHKKARGWWAKR